MLGVVRPARESAGVSHDLPHMSRKHASMLIAPSVVLLLIALAAFFAPSVLRGQGESSEPQRILDELDNGNREVTKDRATAVVRAALRSAEAEHRVSNGLIRGYRQLGMALFIWSFIQLGAVFYVIGRTNRIHG
jgi:hypothetical protein